jgi:hypothetical protein
VVYGDKQGHCEVCSQKNVESRPHSQCSMCKAVKSYGNLEIGILTHFLEEAHSVNVYKLGLKCGTKILDFKPIFQHIRC